MFKKLENINDIKSGSVFYIKGEIPFTLYTIKFIVKRNFFCTDNHLPGNFIWKKEYLEQNLSEGRVFIEKKKNSRLNFD